MGTYHSIVSGAATLLVCAAPLVPSGAAAQEPAPPGALTLEQVLSIAEAQSEAIAGAQAGVRRAQAEQARARSGRRPQLAGSASYDRALASEFAGVFDGGGALPCPPFVLDPAAPIDARIAEIERAIDCGAIGSPVFGGGGDTDTGVDLPFGRENTWRVGLSFSQSVYSGGRFRALDELAAAGRESAELAVETTRAQLLFDVTQAYYDAALSDRLVAIAAAGISQADATFRQVQAGFAAGTQPEFEVLRAQVARDTQTPVLIRQRANRDLAQLRLKQLLELPAADPLPIAALLDDPALAPPPVFAEALAKAGAVAPAPEQALAAAAEYPAGDRTAVLEQGAVVRLRAANVDAARAERFPSVSVNSNFSQVAYPANFFPTGDFRRNWTVGATLQVPILTGGRLRSEEAIAQAQLDQSQADLEQVSELAALDSRSAWAELVAALAAWQASAGTIQQATRAYEIADVRYRSGVSTQLELSDARFLLQQSEVNRAQAARDLQVARARVALLPDLPISGAGAVRPAQPSLPATTVPSSPAVPATAVPGGQLRNASTPAPAGVPR
jgi:outer membrane protein TolC